MLRTSTDLPPGLPASRFRRRLLALALLVSAAATLWLVGAGPFAESVIERHEREMAQRALLQRLESRRGEAPALRRQLDALERDLASPTLLLRAASPSQAGAALQSIVRGLLDAEGLTAGQFQPLPTVAAGALTRIAVRIELRTTLAQLHALLRGIEAHRPLIRVGDALVAAPRGTSAAAEDPLTVRLDVLAMVRVEPGRE
jgi:Tfp pilus assembly protein PilO